MKSSVLLAAVLLANFLIAQAAVDEDGLTLVVSADFDAMMKQAPILDIQQSGFVEYKAKIWHETMGKILATAVPGLSPSFDREFFAALKAVKRGIADDPVLIAKKVIALLETAKDVTQVDTFVKKFTLSNMQETIVLIEASNCVLRFSREAREKFTVDTFPMLPDVKFSNSDLKELTIKEKLAAAAELRAHESAVRKSIYGLSTRPEEPVQRKRVWALIASAALQMEAASRQ